jgi:hypothetical protein
LPASSPRMRLVAAQAASGLKEVCAWLLSFLSPRSASFSEAAANGSSLGDGELEGCIVVCPWHGWKYDVTTGVSTLNAAVRVACYATRIEGEEVQVSC